MLVTMRADDDDGKQRLRQDGDYIGLPHRHPLCDNHVWTVIVYGLAINDPKDYNCFYIEAKIVLRTIFEGKKQSDICISG